MKDNRIIETQLKKHPELAPFYSKESEILSVINKEMTIHLFFEYVIADALVDALKSNNHSFIKDMFDDIELLCEKEYDYYSDIIITTIFENFEREVLNEKLIDYFGKNLNSILKKYAEF